MVVLNRSEQIVSYYSVAQCNVERNQSNGTQYDDTFCITKGRSVKRIVTHTHACTCIVQYHYRISDTGYYLVLLRQKYSEISCKLFISSISISKIILYSRVCEQIFPIRFFNKCSLGHITLYTTYNIRGAPPLLKIT